MAVCVTITVISPTECSPDGIERCSPINPCALERCELGTWVEVDPTGCCACIEDDTKCEDGDLWKCVGGEWALWEEQSDQCASIVKPVPNFSYTVEGLTVAFTDLSLNGPTAWLWDFGDGTTSTLQNPSHTYAKTGHYTVTLAASNSAGTSDTPASTVVAVGGAENGGAGGLVGLILGIGALGGIMFMGRK
jgi:PKD repeat protein